MVNCLWNNSTLFPMPESCPISLCQGFMALGDFGITNIPPVTQFAKRKLKLRNCTVGNNKV